MKARWASLIWLLVASASRSARRRVSKRVLQLALPVVVALAHGSIPSAGAQVAGDAGPVELVVVGPLGLAAHELAELLRPALGLLPLVVALRLLCRGEVTVDLGEVGDDQIAALVVAVREQAGADVAHDVGGRLALVPLHEQSHEPVRVGAAHPDPLAEPHWLTTPLSSVAANSRWMRDIPAGSNAPGDPAATAASPFGPMPSSARTSAIGRVAKRMEVDVEQVDAELPAGVAPASQGVGEAEVHLDGVEVTLAQVAGEEAGVGDVPRLEQPDQCRQPGEALRVRVGSTDEREHLELPVQVGAVVGQHVHEVVLGEVGRGAADRARQAEAPAPVHVPDAAPERAGLQVGEAHPSLGELPILDARGQLVLEPHSRPQLVLAGPLPVLGEAAVVQIEPGQPERALGVAARHDADEPVVDAEGLRVHLDPTGDLRRDRAQDQLTEHHQVHHAMAELGRSGRQCPGELVGSEWFEPGDVDRVAGERAVDGSEQAHLGGRDALDRRDRRGDTAAISVASSAESSAPAAPSSTRAPSLSACADPGSSICLPGTDSGCHARLGRQFHGGPEPDDLWWS